MAAGPRRRYTTSIIIMIALVAGLWGAIAVGCQTETTRKAASASPNPSGTPSASQATTTSPASSATTTVSPSVTASGSPSVKTSGDIHPAASPSAKPTVTPAATVTTAATTTPVATVTPTGSTTPTPSASPATKTEEKCRRPLKPKLGLDLQGGVSVVLAAKAGSKLEGVEKAVDIIRQRIDALGVAEPDVSRQGSNILVQIPGIKNTDQALKIIGKTAVLRFRPVLGILAPGTPQYATAPPAECLQPFNETEGDDPAKPIALCARQKTPDGKDTDPHLWEKLELGPAALIGTDVAGADATVPGGQQLGSGWEVSLRLTGSGAGKFKSVTGDLACNPAGSAKRQLAIQLDTVVESHPQMGDTVQCHQGIAEGTASITGNFNDKDAKDLALVLRFGALPIPLEAQETNVVSPTLGRDSLNGGLIAGAIGLGITLLYVFAFYRILGLVVWVGLAFFAALVFGVVIILGKTAGFSLTLAGIAGLIVSIGIAADSYIVYFERIKDEVHQGKTIRSGVDRAWSSAWRTIVAADLVTALAAIALYVLAVGSVRGFALTLGIATALDLIISYLLMHPSVWLLAQTKFFNNSKRLGIRNVVGDAVPAISGGER